MLGSLETLSNGDMQYTNPYGTWTFQKVPLQKLDGDGIKPNLDKWDGVSSEVLTFDGKQFTQEDQLNALKSQFMSHSLASNKQMQDAWDGISERVDNAIEQFMDGTMSEDQLSDLFQSLAHELFEESCKAGYPLPIVSNDKEQKVAEAFYDEARRRILDIAVKRNNEQGEQYITGEMNIRRTYKYYNSDYYYKSEAAIAAITKGMEDLAQANDWDFTIPDYKGKGMDQYYNFNTALSNQFQTREQYLIDPDMEPPQGFEWFFETGGDPHIFVLEGQVITNPDGSETVVPLPSRTKFDPIDYLTGNTWFAYTDKNGERHVFSTDVIFRNEKSDLMNVGSLFKLPDDEEWDAVRRFLKNLQLYPKGYFTQNADPVSFSCQA